MILDNSLIIKLLKQFKMPVIEKMLLKRAALNCYLDKLTNIISNIIKASNYFYICQLRDQT